LSNIHDLNGPSRDQQWKECAVSSRDWSHFYGYSRMIT
jgi:hypothetical protein